MANKRALSVADIEAFVPNELPFEGQWLDAIGTPELTGSWIIWGGSVNGKTRFALQLAKYLCNFGRVAYDSVEEGLSKSMKKAIKDVGMRDAARRFVLLDKENVDDLRVRLRKKRSPDIVFIDSLQYTGLTYNDYKALRDEFRKKLFIFISHAEGKLPKGQVGRAIRYDAMVKIYVAGYVAYPQSRYGGGANYVIWEKGAAEFKWENN